MKKSLISFWAIMIFYSFALSAQNVAVYTFNQGDARNDAGASNNGVVTGATLTADRFGNANKAYSFAGNNTDNINVGDVSFLNNASKYSISMWIKTTSGNSQGLWHKSNNSNEFIQARLYNNVFYGYDVTTTNISYAGLATSLPQNAWVHYVAVFDGTQGANTNKYKTYINGVLANANFSTANFPTVSPNLTGGSLIFGQTNPTFYPCPGWVGDIDDIHVYGSVLSANQVDSLFNLPDPVPNPTPIQRFCYSFDNQTPNNGCGTTNNGTYIGQYAGLGSDRFNNPNYSYYCGASAIGGVNVGDIPILNDNNEFTIAGWFLLVTPSNPNSNRYLFSKGGLSFYLPTSSSNMTLTVGGQNIGYNQSASTVANGPTSIRNGFRFIAITRKGALLKVYDDATGSRTYNYSGGAPSSAGTNFIIGNNTDMKADDIFIINRAFTATQIDSLRNAPNPACSAPVITQQISGTNQICAGTPFSLSVTATGQNLSYQWKRTNGATTVNVGTNSATYSVANTSLSDGGTYSCVITNTACGNSVTATAFIVAANILPSSVSTFGVLNCLGGNFDLFADGGAGSTYQWQKDGVNITANSSQYSIGTATASDNGLYRCVITNGCGTITTNPVRVVIGAPIFVSQPSTITPSICVGQSFTITTEVAGYSPLIVWKKNGTVVQSGSSATYTVSSATANDAGTYTCEISNTCPNTTAAISSPVSIAVGTGGTPTITNTAGVLSCGTFSSYQWFLNGTAIAGATNATYTPTQNGTYTVQITNSSGCSSTSAGFLVNTIEVQTIPNIEQISISPNPSNDRVTIQIKLENAENIEVCLTDMNGRLLKTWTFENSLSIHQSVDLTNMNSGLYLVKIMTPKGVLTQKVLKL